MSRWGAHDVCIFGDIRDKEGVKFSIERSYKSVNVVYWSVHTSISLVYHDFDLAFILCFNDYFSIFVFHFCISNWKVELVLFNLNF